MRERFARMQLGRAGVVVLLVLGSVGVPLSAWGQPPGGTEAGGEAIQKIATHGGRCAVGIYCKKDGYSSFFGTGAVITPDGYVITSTTVVPPGATDIEVVFPDYVTRAGQIIETNESLETTIVKVEAENLPCLALAQDLPAVGTRAFTFSNANNVVRLSGAASFSLGLVSGVYAVENQGGESLYAGVAVETTAAVNPGSDGGPILNAAGQLCAIISLNVSPARWQGVGVPTKVLLERLDAFTSGRLQPNHAPLVDPASGDAGATALAQQAAQISRALVGLVTRRKYLPEVLPRMPWNAFQPNVGDWDKKALPERTRILLAYYEAARLMEVNQMLRRPPQPATGILISPDGFVLTSLFNTAPDVVFLEKSSGQPPAIKFQGTVQELVAAPKGGFTTAENAVEEWSVLLSDGSQRPAKLVARHVPLGVAVLKIDGADLPHLPLAQHVGAPEVGMPVGLLGFSASAGTPFTLNSGIVSAAARNRGYQFQTDAMLNYGNSGGLVFDAHGKWLGVATAPIAPGTVMGRLFGGPELNGWAMAPNSGVGLIARGDRILEAIEDLKAGKTLTEIPGPLLGVAPDPAKLLGDTAVIGAVTPDSPAAKAGLQKGDRILTLNDEELDSWNDFAERLRTFQPGDKIRLKIGRSGFVKRLLINGKPVANEKDLQALFDSLQPGAKFEGTYEREDTKLVEVELGARK